MVAFRIATVRGIPIRVHWTLLLFAPWIVHWQGWPLGVGLTLYALLFTSIALHELGHAFVAQAFGCRVRDIVLLPIGGVSQLESMPRRPLQEFLVAVAGPAVSIAIGLGLVTLTGWDVPFVHPHPVSSLGDLLWLTGWTNLGLAAFNLLPVFPTDGGRVFRAALTPWLGRLRATRWAARLGRWAALLLGLYAVQGFLTGGSVQWMLLLVAVFLYAVAGREYRMVQQEELRRAQTWNDPQAPGAEAPESAERVIVSPPPYAKGGDEKVPLRVLDKDHKL